MIRTIATIIIAVALLTIIPLLPAQQAQFPPSPHGSAISSQGGRFSQAGGFL